MKGARLAIEALRRGARSFYTLGSVLTFLVGGSLLAALDALDDRDPLWFPIGGLLVLLAAALSGAVVLGAERDAALAQSKSSILERAYQRGRAIQDGAAFIGGAPTTRDEAAAARAELQRRVLRWSNETWRLIQQEQPGREFAFHPTSEGLGALGLEMDARERFKEVGAEKYLSEKLAIMRELLS